MADDDSAMTSNRPYLLRAVHEWISDNGLTPYLVVDAAYPGVRVPVQAIRDGRVVLNVATRAVANLDLGNERICFMARFGGVSHTVGVPIAAVQAIYAHENGQGMMFSREGDAESAVAAAAGDGAASAQQQAAQSTPDQPPPKGPPKLRVIK